MEVNYQPKCPPAGRTVTENPDAGLTLVELLVVVAVAAILLGTALPAFSDLLQSQRLTSQINSLVTDLNLTRSEAIKRVERVLLCKSADQATCDADAQWEDGWIIFPDRNANGRKDPEEPILHARGPLPDGYTLRFRSFHTSDYVRYYPDGHAANTGTFTFCTPRGAEHARAVIIFRGRLRSARVDGGGAGLTCPQ